MAVDWRLWHKVKTGLIPFGFAVTAATGNLDNLIWLSVLSWITWLDSSFAAWRADEPDG